MTKIEFLQNLLGGIVSASDCGQRYIWEHNGTRSIVWVDTLKGGRISIKFKYFFSKEGADKAARFLWHRAMQTKGLVIDAATKADVYQGSCSRFPAGWVARLRCDKVW